MRKLSLSNYLFLVPMLVLGPIILATLIAHGLLLNFIDYLKRSFQTTRRDPRSARIISINSYAWRTPPRRAE